MGQMRGVVTSVFEKHREISVNNLVPQREACSLGVRQGGGWEVSGRVLLLRPASASPVVFFELSAAVTERPGWSPAQILCSEAEAAFQARNQWGGQDFLTLVCGSVPGLTPQEPAGRPCVLRKDLLSMPGGPPPWPTI